LNARALVKRLPIVYISKKREIWLFVGRQDIESASHVFSSYSSSFSSNSLQITSSSQLISLRARLQLQNDLLSLWQFRVL
jgi:hypothetical protein